ncbi:hypothetical protein LTR97_008547 [Elasticomyces elasticus]|uniref:Uncharacterized protein n=1 Tax=Elasticomyces elasticus TaxID=574655 RepID=A0AAN7W1Y4_9PEZI|nr:hypothetical protein LTR97_008547 [Elasticomyces elasticus]
MANLKVTIIAFETNGIMDDVPSTPSHQLRYQHHLSQYGPRHPCPRSHGELGRQHAHLKNALGPWPELLDWQHRKLWQLSTTGATLTQYIQSYGIIRKLDNRRLGTAATTAPPPQPPVVHNQFIFVLDSTAREGDQGGRSESELFVSGEEFNQPLDIGVFDVADIHYLELQPAIATKELVARA